MPSKQEIDRLNKLLQEREVELEALRASSRDVSMMMAMQMSGLAWWKWDVSTGTVCIHGLPNVFPNSYDGDFQISGEEWALILEPADVTDFNESLERFHSHSSDVWVHECRIRRLDGQRRWVEIRGYFCKEPDCGAQDYLVGTILDIDERKKDESEQYTMRRAMEAFFELNQDLIGAIDFRMRPVKLSPSWQTLLGWSQCEMTRMGVECIVHDEDREKFSSAIRRAIDSKKKENFECRAVSKDGAVHWISWKMFADSSLELVFISARDKSEPRRIQEVLLAAKDQADAASRAKSNILAAVSHELRTPLNPILGFSDLLIEEIENEEHLEMLRSINSAGERLTNLVGEMLDFAKVDSGGETVSDDVFSVSTLIEEQVKKLSYRLKLNASQIELNLAESPNVASGATFTGDQAKICRVLSHLIENAVKFSDKPKVSIDSELIVSAEGSVLWHVDIHDNGIGIEPEFVEHIFEPFHLVDDSYSRCREGAGMGLAICKRYVELMGGRLTVRSELGQGSTFSFFLPLRVTQDATSIEPAKIQSWSALFAGRLKVFMVEDNPQNIYYQSRILENIGCELTSVSSGELAMAEYEPEYYDCVLLDLHMPGIGGMEVLKWLRSEEAKAGLKRVPIVVLSADIMPTARSRCIELGADRFIAKPVSPERLQQAIGEVLSD